LRYRSAYREAAGRRRGTGQGRSGIPGSCRWSVAAWPEAGASQNHPPRRSISVWSSHRIGLSITLGAPWEWDDTHPWGDLLRYKSLTASRGYPPDERLHTRPRGDLVGAGWRQLGPLNDWLRDYVGPSRSAR